MDNYASYTGTVNCGHTGLQAQREGTNYGWTQTSPTKIRIPVNVSHYQ